MKKAGIMLLLTILLLTGCAFNNEKQRDKFSANLNETLEIKEIEGYFDFDIKVLSIKKNYPIDTWFYTGDCYAVEVEIKNNSKNDLNSLFLVHFKLIDSSNQELAFYNSILASDIEESLKTEISPSETVKGYLYFFEVNDDGTVNNINSDNINKLQIKVPKKLEENNGTITGDYQEYYIKLK